MPPAQFRPFGFALALALTAPLAACAPSTSHVATPIAAPVATSFGTAAAGQRGTIKLELSRLFGGSAHAGDRRTLGYGLAADRVTHVNLYLMSPGSSGPTLLTASPVALDTSSTLNKTVECAIAAGPNQVIRVDALDASGVKLMSLRGATNVPAGGVATVQVGMTQDCVARIIERLIVDAAPYLTDESLIGALTTFVNNAASYNTTVPQYLNADDFIYEFKNDDVWLTTSELSAWLADTASYERVQGDYSPMEASYLALNEVAKPADYPTSEYDPTLWRVSLIAPIDGVWNSYKDVEPQNYSDGPNSLLPAGDYFPLGAMPPGQFTLLVTHPTNNTKLVFDLGGSFDGTFYFDAELRN